MVTEFEIGQDLGGVDGKELLDRLEFNNNPRINQQIEFESNAKTDAIVVHAQLDLALNFVPSLLQFIRQTGFIHILQEPGAKMSVNPDSSIHDLPGYPVEVIRDLLRQG